MSYPTIESVTATAFGTAATAHACDYPATVNANDLLLLFFSNDNATAQTDPSGYTQLDDQTQGSQVRTGIYAKVAAGTEGGGTIDVPTGAAEQAAAQIYRISGWGGTIATDIDISTVATGNDDSPNATTVTAGWGSDTNLYIVVVGTGDDNETATGAPGGWSGLVTTPSGGGSSAAPGTHSAYLNNTGSTADPLAMPLTGIENWVAWTLAIKPAAASGTIGPRKAVERLMRNN